MLKPMALFLAPDFRAYVLNARKDAGWRPFLEMFLALAEAALAIAFLYGLVGEPGVVFAVG